MSSLSPSACTNQVPVLAHPLKMAPCFSVRRRSPELIVPSAPTPREIKPLSDIDDQKGLREFVDGIIFFQSNPAMHGKDPVSVIREAMAAALVYYYPLAGRLVEGANDKLSVDCTAEGVLFIEADADVTLEELRDAILPPCPNLEELLYKVPGADGVLGCPMLQFQLTRLNCGGFILASRLNHTICDAYGFHLFIKAVGELARGLGTLSILPVWQREIFNARTPPMITCRHLEYEETVKDAKSNQMNMENTIQKSIFFRLKDIQALKEQLGDNIKSSTFDVLAACLWRCRTIALELDPDEEVRFSSMVSVRGKSLLDLPQGYYGNAFVYPAVATEAKLLCENSLRYAVELVTKVKAQMSVEYVRSVADFMVLKGRPTYEMASTYIVSDVRYCGSADVDFGWGKPIYSGTAQAVTITSFCIGYVNCKGEAGNVVPICLPEPVMDRFMEEVKKLTKSF